MSDQPNDFERLCRVLCESQGYDPDLDWQACGKELLALLREMRELRPGVRTAMTVEARGAWKTVIDYIIYQGEQDATTD